MMLIVIYIAAMVAANIIVWWLGPWVSPLLAFTLIGLDLTLRDVLHARLTRLGMFGLILSGAAITFLCNPSASQIAVASAIAFGASALADYAAFSALKGKSWLTRSNGSNVVGAAVDSAIFPTLAFGVVMPHIMLMQFAAKVFGGALWAIVMSRYLVRHEKYIRV